MIERHRWDLSPTEAVALQRELASHLTLKPLEKEIRTIGAADISFNKFSDDIYAAIIVLDYDSMEIIERSTIKAKATFPYVPGLLSFREIPAYLQAWDQLVQKPDVMVMDGQGIAHPRRIGVGVHFGLLTGCPTMGCAKSVFVGKFDPPGPKKGDFSAMIHRDEVIGNALRTRDNVNPVYISPGHLMEMEDCRRIMLHCARGYRIPEPTRQADLLVNELRRADKDVD